MSSRLLKIATACDVNKISSLKKPYMNLQNHPSLPKLGSTLGQANKAWSAFQPFVAACFMR